MSPRPDLKLIVVISSTFHLIRIAPLLEQRILSLWNNTLGHALENVTLLMLGSETAGDIESQRTSPVVWNPRYRKLLFLEVFNYLTVHGLLPK